MRRLATGCARESGSRECAIRSAQRLSPAAQRLALRRKDDTQATFCFVLENVVTTWPVVDGESMRGEEGRVEFAPLRVLDQPRHVFLAVLLRCSNGQAFVHHHAEREFVHNAVDAQNRKRPALSARHDGFAQSVAAIRVHSQSLLRAIVLVLQPVPCASMPTGIDASVRTATARHLLQRFENAVDLLVVDDF